MAGFRMAALRHNPLHAALDLLERPMRAAQGVLGLRRIAWLFLLPNLVIFGLFTFLPIGLDAVYALTGSDRVMLGDRPWVGTDNFASLLACTDYLDPGSCRRDTFWRALFNTGGFVLIQVVAMVGFALLTALVLNRKIRARGFFRACFFFPVLLSPVVVALVWKWMLQRDGLLNAWMLGLGLDPVQWLVDAHWAFAWVIIVSIWAHLGFYTLIVLAGLQAIPGDVLRGRRHGRGLALAQLQPHHPAALDAPTSWSSWSWR